MIQMTIEDVSVAREAYEKRVRLAERYRQSEPLTLQPLA